MLAVLLLSSDNTKCACVFVTLVRDMHSYTDEKKIEVGGMASARREKTSTRHPATTVKIERGYASETRSVRVCCSRTLAKVQQQSGNLGEEVDDTFLKSRERERSTGCADRLLSEEAVKMRTACRSDFLPQPSPLSDRNGGLALECDVLLMKAKRHQKISRRLQRPFSLLNPPKVHRLRNGPDYG